MLRAYVGIANTHGLAVFQPERADTLSRVRRAVNQSCRHVGFWAVLHESEAFGIWRMIQHGQHVDAMTALERHARDIGRI